MTGSRAVVSYPSDLSAWGHDQLRTPWFRGYLRRRLESVSVGETVEVFLDAGCCGDTLDLPLRVERIEGTVGDGAMVEYVAREACGLAGGWLVQSRAGPN